MSQWHRDNPELAGTDADPWMRNESYRKALGHTEPGLDVGYDLEQIREDIDVLSRAALTPLERAELRAESAREGWPL